MSKKIKLSSITPDDKNNNKHTAYGMDLLEKSVNKVGIIESITISNDDKIISGNARHEVIGKNFEKEALVIETDGTQPIVIKRTDIESNTKQFYEASILANTTSKKNIDFDMEVIDSLSVEYDIDVVDLGVDIVNEEILEAEEDDFNGVPPKEPITVLGDLYEIGEHRLLCGDSTDSDQVAKLMNGEKADMVFTDPPYGINVVQGSKVGGDKGFGSVGGEKIVKAKKYSEIIGDDTTDTAKEFYQTCISLGMENFIIWGGNYFTDFLSPSMCWIVWDKQNTGNFADVELAWTSFDKGAKLYKWQWNGMIRQGDKTIEGKTRVHPTQKPVGLFGDIFNDFDFKICFDGFLGSGSTMVASHQLKRKCYGMELDPKYCDVIVARMIKLDSTLPVKRNGVLLTNSEVLKFTENTSESK